MDDLKKKYIFLKDIGLDYKLLQDIHDEITNNEIFIQFASICCLYYYKR